MENSRCFDSRSRTALVTGGTNPVLRSPRIKQPVFKSDNLQQEKKNPTDVRKGYKHIATSIFGSLNIADF